MKSFVADFETTTIIDNCHVWGYGICEIGNKDNVEFGTSIEEFMSWCASQKTNPKIYFHNLKFDGQFLISWLLENGFTHSTTSEDRKTKTFNTLINDKGLFYSIEVVWEKKAKKVRKTVFRDSLKLIPLSVDEIAKTFKLPIQKLNIDYDSHNHLPIGTPLTEEEKAYIKNDIQIVAHAVEYFYSQGLDRITIGSCALEEYKTLISKKRFNLYFPTLLHHDDIKQSYKGGYTYLDPKFAGKSLSDGVVLDINSLFSYVMKTKLLPFGTPIFYRGQYKPDKFYPLYTQMIRCQFELKPGKIPMVQIKHSMFFRGNEYLTSSEDEIVALCLNSVDLEIFLDHYDVYNLEYLSGWKFKGTIGLFDDYVDKWFENKRKAKDEKNPGLYLLSKLFLNSLYGKFGTSNIVRNKIPYLNNKGVIGYKDAPPEQKEGLYVPMASFITSYARAITITSFQKIKDDYASGKSNIQPVYCDTDSLHLLSPDGSLPEELEISDSDLGAWKFESKFTRAKFLRAKCYVEDSTEDVYSSDPEYKLKVTVAGMPSDCYKQVTFRNFKIGATYTGKMQPEIVPGGVVLKNIDFTIQP